MNDRYSPDNSIGVTGITPVKKLSAPKPDPLPQALFLHCALFLAKDKVLGDETFRLVRMEGQESVSEPFEFQLELHANTQPNRKTLLHFDEVIGRPITVGIQYWDAKFPPYLFQDKHRKHYLQSFRNAIEGKAVGKELSLFNGIITSFAMEQPGVYRVVMKPALWKLALTNRYTVYAHKNIRDVIRAVLEQHQMQSDDYVLDAVGGLAESRIQDWFQAGETDYEFLHRLLTKAHIYYYFIHSGRRHKVVFANRPAYRPVFADNQPLRYTHTAADETGMAQCDVISQYSYQQSLTSTGVRGTFTRQHAAWEETTVAAFETYQTPPQQHPGDLPFHQYKIYQYGCGPDEVDAYAKATDAVRATSASRLSGNSFCAHFRVGHSFTMTGADTGDGHPNPVRPTLEGKRFVLTRVKHQASLDGTYQNDFDAAQSEGVITPFSMAETQQGAVVAKVAAHPDGVAPDNWRYYEKNNFAWSTKSMSDSEAAATDKTLTAKGVFVNFSTDAPGAPPTWIKLAPHMQNAPEIDVSVLVARAQDESELPEIQSIVQANGSTDVVPDDRAKLSWTANTHVGSSYSTQYADGISIRFGGRSEAKLPEAIKLVEGKYDAAPLRFREVAFSQGGSYSYSSSEKDAYSASNETELFGPHYAGEKDLLSASESFGSTYNRRYGAVSSEFSDIGISYGKSKAGKTENYNTVTGTAYSKTTHGGKVTNITTINADSDTTQDQKGNAVTTNTLKGDATTTQTNTGSVTNTTTVNGNTTNTTTHKGNVTATTKITGVNSATTTMNTSRETNHIGSQSTSTAIGARNSNDVIGVSNSNSLVGLTNTNSAHLISANISLGLSSNDLALILKSTSLSAKSTAFEASSVGVSSSVSLIGTLNKVEVIGAYGLMYEGKPAAVEVKNVATDIKLLSAIKLLM